MTTRTRKTSVEQVEWGVANNTLSGAFYFAKNLVIKQTCDNVIEFVDYTLHSAENAVDLDTAEEYMKSNSEAFCANQGFFIGFFPEFLQPILRYIEDTVLGNSCVKAVNSFISGCFDKVDDYYDDHMTPIEILEARADSLIDNFCPGRLVNITLTETKREMMKTAGADETTIHDEL